MTQNPKQSWREYCETELRELASIFAVHDITLDEKQPHLGGERFLMQAVTTTSGKKLILIGSHQNRRAVIKVTRDPNGIRELKHERTCRRVLNNIKFAYNVFHSPKELLFTKHGDFIIAAYEYIAQEKTFLERNTEEQFDFALAAFKAQESAHATTYEHEQLISETFGISTAEDYLNRFATFKKEVCATHKNHGCVALFEEAEKLLTNSRVTLERYGNFLTHTDFVPHNFRIREGTMYLLDHSSIRFGNKYEGWARFINFMALYNPQLAEVLIEYVRDNRTEEESQALKCMRIYRLGEIIYYYTKTLKKSADNLLKLNEARVDFWTEVLKSTLKDTLPSNEAVTTYTKTRDTLRSEDEKERQTDLH